MERRHSYKSNPLNLAGVIFLLAIAIAMPLSILRPTNPEQQFLRQYHFEVKDCASAKGLAEKQARAGRLTLLVRPPYENDQSKMPYAFYKKLKEDYGITKEDYGITLVHINSCLGIPEEECFNSVGLQALEEKYGKDHLHQLYEKMHIAQYGPRIENKTSTTNP